MECLRHASVHDQAVPRSTFSGPCILVYFCCIQFLTYFDRGVMSGLLTYVEDEFDIDGFHGGLLGSCYFVPIMIIAPMIAAVLVSASGRRQMYGVALGSLLWAFAVVLCSAAPTYWVLLLGRVGSGFGEACYCVLASPMVKDAAPSAAAALLMLPLALFGVVYADRFHATATSSLWPSAESEMHFSWRASVAHTLAVLTEPRYAFLFFGYGASIFSLNGLNYWAPTYLEQTMHTSKAQAGILLGVVVVATGLAGTIVGSLVLGQLAAGDDAAARCRHAALIS